MTTNRPEFKEHDDFIFEHKKIGKVTREEFIKYIRSSHKHMRKLSQIIQQYDLTIDDYLEEWDGRFESFDDDVKDLLGRWIQDGTMDTIINENLMSIKADKTYVDDLNENVTAQLAQTAVDAKIGKESSKGTPNIHLDIPTYDGFPTATHPDVLYIPNGWNGYTHWMAFTPYPDGGRENPSVIASNNGVDWEVPEGLTNPIADNADARARGFTYWSDTDIILLPDNRLAVYFRGSASSKEGIYRMTSTDGVNWGEIVLVLEIAMNGRNSVLSPAIIVEDNNSFTMYTINDNKSNTEKLEKRTSSDGINWGSPIQCYLPEGYTPWHVDVVKANGEYHALVASDFVGANGRLYYSTSKDGISFVGDDTPAVPLSGYTSDSMGHYRSTLVPIAGNPLSFKVYVASWGSTLGTGDPRWKILYYDNVVFDKNTFRSIKKVDRMAKEHERIYIPARDFEVGIGSLERGKLGIGDFYWEMPVGNAQLITNLSIPSDWENIKAYVLASSLDGSSGDVMVRVTIGYNADGEEIPSGRDLSRSPLDTHAINIKADNSLTKGFVWGNSVYVNTSTSRFLGRETFNWVRVLRANDKNTYEGRLAFHGVVLEKAENGSNYP